MIYFIICGAKVKIGFSANPEKRLKNLQTGNAALLSLAATMQGTVEHEKELHKRFEGYNINGEWFSYKGELKAFILNIPRQPKHVQYCSPLDEYIRKHHIKASDFAAAVGLSQGSISRLRRGTQTPSLEAAIAIERETNGKVKPKDFSAV